LALAQEDIISKLALASEYLSHGDHGDVDRDIDHEYLVVH